MEETKKNTSRQGIAPEANMENIMRAKEEEDLKYNYNYPEDFKITDPQVVAAFFKRFADLRERRQKLRLELDEKKKYETETPEANEKEAEEEQRRKKLKQELENKKWTREECARAIGISEAMLSKYENGKPKSIPQNRLDAICDYFSVTTHYMLGISSEYDKIVEIDRFGKIVYNQDGKPRELTQAFISYPILAEDAVKRYEALYKEHPTMFWSIHHLINAPEAKRKKVAVILEQLADL